MVQFNWTISIMSAAPVKTIGVTAFKAKCLGLVEEVAMGRTARVILTKRGKPVAELSALARPARGHSSSYGALKGMIQLDPSVDLTAPTGLDLEWDAAKGILFNE